jgi:hypothetical protein
MNKTYVISYKCSNKNFSKDGVIKVKNCMSDLHAKSKLEDYLKGLYNIDHLEVVSCRPDVPDILNMFNDIFK